MGEALAGVAGGLGLFFAGMHLLTENLKALAGTRMRKAAQRWTRSPAASLLWGLAAGTVTQSMAGATFVAVSILRGGFVELRTAIALCLGAGAGVTTLVLIVTLDAKTIALCLIGISAAVIASEHMASYRSVASAVFGAALLVLGLFMLKDSVAPLATQPWVRDVITDAGSLIGTFLVCALLAALVQSSSAICVVLISLQSVGVVSGEQVLTGIYASGVAGALSLYALGSGLDGRAKQLTMSMVWYNLSISTVMVTLFVVELTFDIALVKAALMGGALPMEQKLALFYVALGVLPMVPAFVLLGPIERALRRRYPESEHDVLARPRYLHDQAHVDGESALMLADLELKRILSDCSAYFQAFRRGEAIAGVRAAIEELLQEVGVFLDEAAHQHPSYEHERRNALANRARALQWLNQSLATLCEAFGDPAPRTWLATPIDNLRDTLRESAEAALLTLIDALEDDDEFSWEAAHQVTRDRSELMNRIRSGYFAQYPQFDESQVMDVLLATNAFEEVFYSMRHLEDCWNPNRYRRGGPGDERHDPGSEHGRR